MRKLPEPQSFSEDQYTQPQSARGRGCVCVCVNECVCVSRPHVLFSFPTTTQLLFPINGLFVAEKVRESVQEVGGRETS